ncbi:Uncharacterised protein [Legionella lansingensis]|uniref:Uncharacterized protein n=1 Tax=Legionella lansingensis TaxID=45067 RepID=A0A0W0VRV1_9GAMM|nr:hypothetical protein [Legionella lansingensis]KTD22834.1 hypothetical protein Llan_1075 [Legionella lansingensis]SNV49635.1 Uncharacterised protein [Legionella lansingensis]
MKDSLAALEESLAYMFELQTRETGTYINSEVQTLKETLEKYKDGSASLSQLIVVLKQALPVIGNYVDGYIVKFRMEAVAEENGMYIVWDTPDKRKRTYPHFNYGAGDSTAESASDFTSWLSSLSGLEFSHLDKRKQVDILLNHRSEMEFMTKLREYLVEHPDFLCNFILESHEIFIEIITTRVGFQLNNEDIAKAIVHHSTAILNNLPEPQDQVASFIEFWDSHLSVTGRSVARLFNDNEARTELEKLEIFQISDADELGFTF